MSNKRFSHCLWASFECEFPWWHRRTNTVGNWNSKSTNVDVVPPGVNDSQLRRNFINTRLILACLAALGMFQCDSENAPALKHRVECANTVHSYLFIWNCRESVVGVICRTRSNPVDYFKFIKFDLQQIKSRWIYSRTDARRLPKQIHLITMQTRGHEIFGYSEIAQSMESRAEFVFIQIFAWINFHSHPTSESGCFRDFCRKKRSQKMVPCVAPNWDRMVLCALRQMPAHMPSGRIHRIRFDAFHTREKSEWKTRKKWLWAICWLWSSSKTAQIAVASAAASCLMPPPGIIIM